MLTLYWMVKRSEAESVPDRASVHTRNASFKALTAPKDCCSVLLLKCGTSDKFLKRSESSLNTFIGPEIAMEPRLANDLFKSKKDHCKLQNG